MNGIADLSGFDGFLIDLDGTIYRGDLLIDGAADTVRRLFREGKRVVFVSNRGNISRDMCKAKLAGMGLDVPAESLLLTSTASGMYLKERDPDSAVWVLGEQGLKDELATFGIRLAPRPEDSDWLVITLHETVTYRELNMAFRAIRSGARILATNEDRMVPTAEGDSLDVAGMIGAVCHPAGRWPDVVIGKPSEWMAQAALRTLGLPPERCLVIGDSLHSDIALAKRHGMSAALVLTGLADHGSAYGGEYKPDYVWDSIAGLNGLLEGV
ncbi:HAD-IIA family hydrolase [Cohnella zeiphila]|uniref:HAD-IIA family hydrolase n=1 Tax=Cohnella zeiphila TaxID=2761120 RepID=UPI003B588968